MPSASDVSFYLLNSGYRTLIANPESAIEGLPTTAKAIRNESLDFGTRVAYVWEEPVKERPVFTELIQVNFDSTFEPELYGRHSALIFVEVKVADPYDQDKVHERVIGATFGNGHNKLASTSIQLQFGKTAILNVSDPDNLELLKKNIPGVRGKTILEELHVAGGVYDFMQLPDIFDVAKIGARTQAFGNRSAEGADHLRIRIELTLDAIHDIANTLLLAFVSTEGRNEELAELEHLTEVVEETDRTAILSKLYDNLAAGLQGDCSVIPRPELKAGEKIILRTRASATNAILVPPDLTDTWTTEDILRWIRVRCKSFDQFLRAKIAIQRMDSESGKFMDRSSKDLTKYLSYVSESNVATREYPVSYRDILNEGRFYRCPAIIHDRLAKRLSSVDFLAPDVYPSFDRKKDLDSKGRFSENAYNARVSEEKKWACLDKASLRAQIRGSKVEFCDIFIDGLMVCVKRTISSDAVAKVCQQAMDAALTIENYPDAWAKVVANAAISFPEDPLENRKAFRFVIALIDTVDKHDRSKLNLKSQLAISRARGDIQYRGYGFEVHFITDPGQ